MSRGTDSFCFGLSFQGCLYSDSEQPWKTEVVSPSRVEGKLLSSIIKMFSYRANVRQVCLKDLGSLCLVFLSCDTFIKLPCMPPWDLGSRGPEVNIKIMLLALPWVIKFFVCDPKVTRLLPASIKPWQAHIVALKERKFQTLHNSWQTFQRRIHIIMKVHQFCIPVFQVA